MIYLGQLYVSFHIIVEPHKLNNPILENKYPLFVDN